MIQSKFYIFIIIFFNKYKISFISYIQSFQSTACSSGETNVELFTEKAQIQNISICSHLTNVKSTLKLPVHQRYRYAGVNDKYINISLPDPKLLLGCRKRLKEYRISKIDLCSPCVDIVPKWREIPYLILNNNVCCKNIKNISYLYNFINRKLLKFLIFFTGYGK